MLSASVYPIIFYVVWGVFGVFMGIMALRMIFSYTDPNPFGAIGRFGFKVRKVSERWVYPSARFLANFRIDTRLAPLMTLFIAFVFTFFAMQIVGNTFFIIDNLTAAAATGNS